MRFLVLWLALVLTACGVGDSDGIRAPVPNVVVLPPEVQAEPGDVVFQVKASDDIFSPQLFPVGDCVTRTVRGQVELKEGCSEGVATFPAFEAVACGGQPRWLDFDFLATLPPGGMMTVYARVALTPEELSKDSWTPVGQATANVKTRWRFYAALRYLQFQVVMHGAPAGIALRSLSAVYDCKF